MRLYSVSYKENGYGFPGGWITPFVVGPYAGQQNEFQPIDTGSGDSIAHLNPYFGELTGQYWLWRNRQPGERKADDYIGFCHYRRYFNLVPNDRFHENKLLVDPTPAALAHLGSAEQEARAAALLGQFDMLATRQVALPFTIREQFNAVHDERIWQAFVNSIRSVSPPWIVSCLDLFDVSYEFRFYPIFITRWDIFEEWCELLFPVLFDVFRKIGPLPEQENVRFQVRRYPAYLSERFFMLYLHARRLRVYGAQVVCFEADA